MHPNVTDRVKRIHAAVLHIRLQLALLTIISLGISGCVSTTISTQDKTATATGILGTQTLALNTHPLLVVDSGFGIFSRSGELTIGWLKESRVYLGDAGDDCRIIVLPDNPGQVQELINILKKSGESISQICVVKP